MILDSYYAMTSAQRSGEKKSQDHDENDSSRSDAAVTGEAGGIDLDSLTGPYSGGGESSTCEQTHTNGQSRKAYDRTAMTVLGNNIVQDGRASSPYRRGSFDLLGLLATQESIHRVLREYRLTGEDRDVSFQWLKEFYVSRVALYFDGNQEYGRADDFLEELLLTAPSVKEMENGKLGLIDPLRMAEDIISMRSTVARDWRDIVVDVPTKDHAELRKLTLAIRMGKTIEKSPSVSLSLEESLEGFQ